MRCDFAAADRQVLFVAVLWDLGPSGPTPGTARRHTIECGAAARRRLLKGSRRPSIRMDYAESCSDLAV